MTAFSFDQSDVFRPIVRLIVSSGQRSGVDAEPFSFFQSEADPRILPKTQKFC